MSVEEIPLIKSGLSHLSIEEYLLLKFFGGIDIFSHGAESGGSKSTRLSISCHQSKCKVITVRRNSYISMQLYRKITRLGSV